MSLPEGYMLRFIWLTFIECLMYFRPQCNHFILLLKSYTGLFKGLCIEGLVYDLKNKYEKKKKRINMTSSVILF